MNFLQQLQDLCPGPINMRNIFVLDTGTTGHSIVNNDFAYDIQELNNPVCQDTSAGSTMIRHDCRVPGLEDRPLINSDGMTNCLGMGQLVDHCYRITMDTAEDDAFYLHMQAGEVPICVPRNSMNLYTLPVGKDFLKKVVTLKTDKKKNNNHLVVTSSLRPGAVHSVKDFTSIVEVAKDGDATAGMVDAGVKIKN